MLQATTTLMFTALWLDIFLDVNLLRKLAFALEEGTTFDEEDPDLNINLHYFFYNFSYGQKMESLFFASNLKGSKY